MGVQKKLALTLFVDDKRYKQYYMTKRVQSVLLVILQRFQVELKCDQLTGGRSEPFENLKQLKHDQTSLKDNSG